MSVRALNASNTGIILVLLIRVGIRVTNRFLTKASVRVTSTRLVGKGTTLRRLANTLQITRSRRSILTNKYLIGSYGNLIRYGRPSTTTKAFYNNDRRTLLRQINDDRVVYRGGGISAQWDNNPHRASLPICWTVISSYRRGIERGFFLLMVYYGSF